MASDRMQTMEEVEEGLENLLNFILSGSSDEAVIRSLNNGCSKMIEDMLTLLFMDVIKEKDDIIFKTEQELLKEKNRNKVLEEQMRQIEEEIENIKREKHIAENETVFISKLLPPETIQEYKINHYCCVCEKSAAFVCCLNTSYCSSDCQATHAKDHQPFCSKNDHCGSIIQQPAVFLHQSESVITTRQSAPISSTNPETSDSHMMTSFTHHKKTGIKRVACTSPPDSPGPFTRSRSSKSRRRYR